MPFIPAADRLRLASPKELPKLPGEACYLYYKSIVEAWKIKPSWSLWHNIVATTFGWNDDKTAKALALSVFFIEHVMPYEQQKKQANGDIS